MGTLFPCDEVYSSKWLSTESAIFEFRLNSNMYFPFDGHVMLSNLVEMHSGNTYFRWISMNFSIIYLIFDSSKNIFKWKCELDMFYSKMTKTH